MRYRFLPKVRASHPVIGMMTALETRYDVRTHADSSIPDERDPRMWSRATFATLVSMISISVGSITVMATIHLLAPIAPTAFPNRPPSPFNVAYRMKIVGTTDIPIRRTWSGSSPRERTIFTGTRCTTFT